MHLCLTKRKQQQASLSSSNFHNSEEQVKMAADLSSAVDSTLASQCMAFCQALASQGKDFSFTLKIDSTFSFSLDTRETNVKATLEKKRTSPSTQRRNARRREEFLRKKLNFSSVSSSALDAPADVSHGATTVAPANATCSSAVASTPVQVAAPLPSQPSQQEANISTNQVQVEFRCDTCEDTFNLEADLGQHMRKVHKDYWRWGTCRNAVKRA